MLKVAVCDDDKECLSQLCQLLEEYRSSHMPELRYTPFTGAFGLLSAIECGQHFDIAILDILMPNTNGIQVAEEIRRRDEGMEIVFLSSSPGFAYESYSVHARDYLLKPIQAELLFALLDQIALREKKPQEGITVKSGATLIRILFSQLSYVEVSGKHLFFNLTDGTVREVYGTLKEYEPLLLSRPEFLQVHRSYIVNMLEVEELSSSGIRTFSGKQLPVSRLLYPQVQKDYMKLLFAGADG